MIRRAKSHWRKRAAVALALAFAALFAVGVVVPAFALGVVSVQVTSGSNPVANAQVTLVQFNGTATGLSPSLTGSNGQASVPYEGKGLYQITAAKFGFVNATKSWHLNSANFTTTLTFSLTANSVPITINAGSGPSSPVAYVDGAVTTLPATENWLIGSTHNVTAAATFPSGSGNSSRWGWAGWQGGPALRKQGSYHVTASATLTANYQVQNLLTERFNATRGSLAPAQGYYNATSSVSVVPTAKSGFHFVNFTLDAIFTTAANPLPLQMNAPHAVKAVFAVNSVAYTFTVKGPATLAAKVDGGASSLPATFNWAPGSKHTVVFAANNLASAGIRWTLAAVHDAAVALPASNLTITVGNVAASYNITFSKQFLFSVNSTDPRAVKPSASWFPAGKTVNITAPVKVTLADGSFLFLQSYTLDGSVLQGSSVQVPMTAPHALTWNYLHEYRLTVEGLSNQGTDLGGGAYFMIQPQAGTSFQVANHNATFLAGGTYTVAMFYGGAQANATTVILNQNVNLKFIVDDYGTAGQFNFKVVNGFLVGSVLSNSNLTIIATGVHATLRVFIPPGVYAQDFFAVGGVTNSSFDQTQRLLTVVITGRTSISIGAPGGSIFALATTSSGGAGEAVQASLNGNIVSEFSAFCGSNAYQIGVNFQNPTQQLASETARPFRPIYDPNHQYTLEFGYCANGEVLVAVKPLVSLQLTKVFLSPQYGQLLEISPLAAPTSNPYTDIIQRNSGTSGCQAPTAVYEVDLLGKPVGAVCWTLSTAGGGVAEVWFYNLENQLIGSNTVASQGNVVFAVQGSLGSVSIAFQSWDTTSANVIFYGTSQPAVKELPGGFFGPQSVTFDGNPVSASMVCNSGSPCQETGGPFGGFDAVKLTWKALPTGGSFNVTINGVLLMENGNSVCGLVKNMTAAQQPGIDLNQCVNGSPAQGTTGDGYFTFVPSRAGQFSVCVSSRTFAGTYQGCESILTVGNSALASVAAVVVIVVVAILAFVFIKRRAPPPSTRAVRAGVA